MNNADLIARLPPLEKVHETLRTTDPGEVLATALAGTGTGTGAAAGPMARTGLESVAAASTSETLPGAGRLPRNESVEGALQAQREATVAAGHRAVQKILRGGPETPLAPSEQIGLEAIVLLFGRPALLIQDGRFLPPPEDWQVLETKRAAIEDTFLSVGRVEVDGHPSLQWIGTGFLVAPDILITNRHVALEFTEPRSNGRWGIARGMKARVDYKEDLGAGRSAEFAIERLIGMHGRYDMALFRVARKGGAGATLDGPAPLPLAATPESLGPVAGRTVYVVGYPAWDGRRNDPEPMQRLFGNIYNVKRLQPGTVMRHDAGERKLTHDCSTLGGNSGSCVVDLETQQVIGLHFGGQYRQANDAVALWQLQDDPLIRLAGLAFAGQS